MILFAIGGLGLLGIGYLKKQLERRAKAAL